MTAVEYADVAQVWGADGVVHLPLAELDGYLEFGDELLPDRWALPTGVRVLFTVDTPDTAPLFSVLRITPPGGEPLLRVVLGATEDDQELLYVLDVRTGAVELLNTAELTLERINSSLALFVEFLYRIVRLTASTRDRGRVEELRNGLTAADPVAFTEDRSWWHSVFDTLAR